MNWKRKEAERIKEKRGIKPVKPIGVIVNMPDPKKEFQVLPIILDWWEDDNVPILVVLSPHERFNTTLMAYYDSIRRLHNYAWHTDDIKCLDMLSLSNSRQFPKLHAIEMFAYDPDRMSMTELMRLSPAIHVQAKLQFEGDLERQRESEERMRNRTNRRPMSDIQWNFSTSTYNMFIGNSASGTSTTWISLG